jgi:hypothetical protein
MESGGAESGGEDEQEREREDETAALGELGHVLY